MPWDKRDAHWMEMAFAEAGKVKGRTLPNPPVGAVLVGNGRVIGRGGTQPAGQAHAEIIALRQARENARGAALYVTLEPCRHFGRTPPCTRALIEAGVKRVVAACEDPNPAMSGKGFADLKRAGIAVETGLLADVGAEFYAGFFFFIRRGRPKIVVKIAQSLDGRINGLPGVETALTSKDSLRFTHALRARADAILIGGGTLRSDNPRLTPRLAPGPIPEALVLTRQKKLNPKLRLFAPGRGKTTVITTAKSGISGLPESVDIRNLPEISKAGDASLARGLLRIFREKGYHLVLVEGSRSVWAPFLNTGLCDELLVFTAPKLFPAGERWDANLRPGWAKFLEFHRFTSFEKDALAEFRRAPKPAAPRI